MKIEFAESDYGCSIVLVPETQEETCQLARVALNTSSEKPTIYMYFSGNEPSCEIFLKKRKPNAQTKLIKP